VLLDRFRPEKSNEVPFIILASFLITFIATRLFVHFFPFIFINIKGVHIHHFAYGIIILTLVGFFDLVVRPKDSLLRWTSVVFGIGMAISYDEFGMWLRLDDDGYWRYGYDAAIVISSILLNIVYFGGFWKKLGRGTLLLFRKIRRRFI